MSARAEVRITGRVQGVLYRATCEEQARARGLKGWVRNGPEGVVQAVFEGPRGKIEDMLAWCRIGPPAAKVENVIATWSPARGEQGFRIKH